MPRAYPPSVLRLLAVFKRETRSAFETKDELAIADILLPMAELIYESGRPHVSNRPLKPREAFIRQLYLDFREVIAAYQTLLDFPALARSKPPRRSTLSPARLVAFWREAYLNEFYIFHCRLDAYVSRVIRSYRHDRRLAALSRFQTLIRDLIQGRFGDYIEMRGGHVHRHRYEYGDPELQRLQLLEMLATGSKLPAFRRMYATAARQAKKQNTETFKLITREAQDALKAVFDSFEGFMLDQSGNLLYPVNLT
jgi:hypothetical protein